MVATAHLACVCRAQVRTFSAHDSLQYAKSLVFFRAQVAASLQGAPDQWVCDSDQMVHHMQPLEAAPLLPLRCL